MSKFARWIILNVALGVFPLGIRILIRLARGADVTDVLINSSDIIFLCLTLCVTTLADIRDSRAFERMGASIYDWTLYTVGAFGAFAAVWYGILEGDLHQMPTHSPFRDNTWRPAVVYLLGVIIVCALSQWAISQSERNQRGTSWNRRSS